MAAPMSLGWFGIPGAPSWMSTKTHVLRDGQTLCGTKLTRQHKGESHEFQFCCRVEPGRPPSYKAECERCEKALRALAAEANRNVFSKLKKGAKVRDRWYGGIGTVLKVLRGGADIRFVGASSSLVNGDGRWDKPHINQFLEIL